MTPLNSTLRLKFESPKEIALKKFIDLSLEAPTLIGNFQPPEGLLWALLKTLGVLTEKVKEGLHEYQKQQEGERSSGLSLLLKIPRKFKK